MLARLKLGLSGFVFTKFLIGFIFIILCYSATYVDWGIREIGFVLHN
jgi:hypothetical protein